MKSLCITNKGLIREKNEDNYIYLDVEPNICCFAAVIDGMGGENKGELASSLCKTQFENYVQQNACNVNNQKIYLLDACSRVNNYLYNYSKENHIDTFGTTFVGGFFYKKFASIINVGDSRAFHVSINNHSINRLTKDHVPYLSSLHNNYITMAIGSSNSIFPDYYEFLINDDSIIILCSDGIYRYISEDELLNICLIDNIDTLKNNLINIVFQRGAPDNFTLVLLRDFYD